MSKMWSGRFKEESSSLLDEFNASIMFDRELYAQDIKGSIAHSQMLSAQGIITADEQRAIEKGLLQVKEEIESGKFEWNIKDEDIHMAIESRLTEIIGEVGKKLHTARSRNDQVATDFRLYVQEKNLTISNQLKELMKTLLKLSSEHTETLMPGMTHLQHAQPINFGYHMLAYVSMFKRDYERFQSSFERSNFSPLGCAALAGTVYPIDRQSSCEKLGFIAPTNVCLDTVSDRDFALEILFNISLAMMHISRLSEELILWSSYEFKFVTIADRYATGSSIMPQKKNPDVPELLRGKTGRVYGNLMSLLTVMKGLPLAYNKDTQEDKEGVFDSIKTIEISLEILNEVIKTLKVNKQRLQAACKVGHLSATDLADFLVQKLNIPFRDAHFITGAAVAKADELGKDISELSLSELRSAHKKLSSIDEEVLKYLNLKNSMNARDSYGGTSTKQTLKQIEYFKEWLNAI